VCKLSLKRNYRSTENIDDLPIEISRICIFWSQLCWKQTHYGISNDPPNSEYLTQMNQRSGKFLFIPLSSWRVTSVSFLLLFSTNPVISVLYVLIILQKIEVISCLLTSLFLVPGTVVSSCLRICAISGLLCLHIPTTWWLSGSIVPTTWRQLLNTWRKKTAIASTQ